MLRIKWDELFIKKGESKGYLNFEYLMYKIPYPFIFIIGARGVGKTYGGVGYTYTSNTKTLFLRRTQSQADAICKKELFSGREYYKDHNIEYYMETVVKGCYGIWTDVTYDEKGKVENLTPVPNMYLAALSTLYNIRGISGEDVDMFLYDEFIPEPHAKPIKKEGEALLNAYESFNRNRELAGKNPIKLIALSNSNKLANPMFADLNLIIDADKAFAKGIPVWVNEKRGFVIINIQNSPISEKKRETALYKFAQGTDFSAMALDNQFRDYRSKTKSYDIKSLKAMAKIGDITLCKVKGNNAIYLTGLRMECPVVYENTEKDMEKFSHTDLCKGLWAAYLDNEVEFENYNIEYLYKRYCKKV